MRNTGSLFRTGEFGVLVGGESPGVLDHGAAGAAGA